MLCEQCLTKLCCDCFKITHATANYLRKHTHLPITMTMSNLDPCPLHPGELKRHYCMEDDQLICLRCSLGPLHSEHTMMPIAPAVSPLVSL